jgi:hypothetical protein
MPANYRKGDGIGHVVPGMKRKDAEATVAFLKKYFEVVCDLDEREIQFQKRSHRYSLTNAIIKTVIFVPEYILTLLFQGRKEAHAKYEMQILYLAFICGKITEKDLAEASSVLSLELLDRLKNDYH